MKHIFSLMMVLLVASCTASQTQPETPTVPAIVPTDIPQADMPNPAAVFCEEQGYTIEIRTAADGSQYGVCIFPDGSECDEWAFFHGECGPSGASPQPTAEIPDGWSLYFNDVAGFSFQYPANASVEYDATGFTVSVNGPVVDNEVWPVFMLSFPPDRQEYRPPEGTDLRQWLTDHNLLLDEPQADAIIGGTTAIHTRFQGSPQSYAHDRYFLAQNGQLYTIVIIHTGNYEDWELYNHFLNSFQFVEPGGDSASPTPIPAALPVDPAIYQDWTTYTNATYGFTLRFPDTWIIKESSTDSHLLIMSPVESPEQESIRVTFRRIGEEALLWPTGVGEGEFIPQGTLDIAGQPATRLLLVCPAGEVTSIWYHQAEDQANITRGDLEFGIIFSATPYHCQNGFSLSGELQLLGESIIASLAVP